MERKRIKMYGKEDDNSGNGEDGDKRGYREEEN